MRASERDREAARVLVEAANLKWLSDQRKLSWHEYVIEIVAESSVAARHEGDAAGYARGLEDAAAECEKAFGEADTLNLLHGAARIRALPLPTPPGEEDAT